MKNVILNAYFKEFKEDNQLELSDSDAFELFSIHSIEAGWLRSSNDPSKIHLSGSEFGIDGLALTINEELVTITEELPETLPKLSDVELSFYQSKMGNGFDYGDISKFFDAVLDFFTDKKETSADVTNVRDAFDLTLLQAVKFRQNPILRLFYNTSGSYKEPTEIQDLIHKTNESLRSLSLFSSVSIDMVGATQLQESYKSSGAAEERKIRFENSITLPDMEKVQESHLGYIPARELLNLAVNPNTNELDTSVFYDNIRAYDESSTINKEVSNSIANDEATYFLLKNNGITIVARQMRRTSDDFYLSGFQIVNGCQTTHVLFANKDMVEGIKLPLKLVVCDDEDVSSQIIVGTNSQNSVKPEHFWALKPFMKDFEAYSRNVEEQERLFIERRPNQYRLDKVEKARVIKSPEVMKSVTSVLCYVGNRAGRSYASVRKDYSERLFKNPDRIPAYHFACFTAYRLEYLFRNGRVDRKHKIFRYIILTSVGRVLLDDVKLLEINAGSANKVAENAMKIVVDDDEFTNLVIAIIERILAVPEIASSNSDNLRDLLRNEEVSNKISSGIAKLIEERKPAIGATAMPQ